MIQGKITMLQLAAFLLAFFSAATFHPTIAAAAGDDYLFINCGASGAFADVDNRIWVGDVDSEFLLTTSTSHPSSLDAAPAIPFTTARVSTSEFIYSLPVPPGRVFLRLYFYPADYLGHGSAESAVFHVSAGSHLLLANFTPAVQPRQSPYHSIVREYSLNASSSASNGMLHLTFTPSPTTHPGPPTYAFINGIELVRSADLFTPRDPLPLIGISQTYPLDASSAVFETMERLNAGGGAIAPSQDSGGQYRSWAADYLDEGRILSTDPDVEIRYPSRVPEYFAPRAVYGTQRAMTGLVQTNKRFNLTWTVPVDPGFYYLVRLHFCELSKRYNLPNKRVFDVFVNGMVGYREADVFAWSGGVGVPTYQDYVTFMPNGGGKVGLRVDLHPDDTTKPEYVDAVLNGLEVFKINDYQGNLAFRGAPAVAEATEVSPGMGMDEEGHHDHHGMMVCCVAAVVVIVACLVSLSVFITYKGQLQSLAGCSQTKNVYSQIVDRYVRRKSAMQCFHDDLKKKTQHKVAVGAACQTTNDSVPLFHDESKHDETLPFINKGSDDANM